MTSSSPPPLKRRMGCLPIALIVLGVVILVLIVGGYSGAAYYSGSRVAAKTKEVERLRQRGIPTDPLELAKSYHSNPEAQQLGEAFVKAFDVYKASHQFYNESDFQNRITQAGELYNPEHIEALRTHLALNAGYMAELRELLRESRDVQYPIDFSLGLRINLEFADDVRVAVFMFVASANIAAVDGDAEGVLRNVSDAVRMAETLRTVPILIVQLIRTKCVSIILNQCEYAVNTLTFPKDSLEHVQTFLGDLDLDGMIALGMRGELCSFHMDVLFADEPDLEKAAPLLGILQTRATFLRDVWISNLFLSQCEVIGIGDATPWERQPLAEQVERKLDNQRPLFHLLELILLPASSRAYETENRVLSATEITKSGLAALAYAHDTGKLPDDLGILVPNYMDAVPLDAYDGQPVRYRRTDTGFVVYSIAHDRVDNGGNPPPEDKRIFETGDLVFRVFDATPYLQRKDAA